jgi:hypothetical protein
MPLTLSSQTEQSDWSARATQPQPMRRSESHCESLNGPIETHKDSLPLDNKTSEIKFIEVMAKLNKRLKAGRGKMTTLPSSTGSSNSTTANGPVAQGRSVKDGEHKIPCVYCGRRYTRKWMPSHYLNTV